MIAALAPWAGAALIFLATAPWSAAVGGGAVLTTALTLGLAGGGGALILFWSALVGGGWSLTAVFACMLLLGAAGTAVWHIRRRKWAQPPAQPPLGRAEWGALALIGIVAAAVLFNSAYFPFAKADALGIYHPAALTMYETGTLEPLIGAESLYRTYPILVPLNYTLAYALAGWEHEYLAKTLAALLSLGCLPAAFLLGREIGGRRVGLLTALILAITPSFVRWASSGYVDLPMAFFYTLTALFALRFRRGGGWIDGALAGLMLGFAAFTKNAALIGVPLLAAWLAESLWASRSAPGLKRRAGAAVLSLALCALIAAPWYLRNLAGAGFLIPDTAWTEQAERSLRTLLIFVTLTDNFLISGWLMLWGAAAAVWQLARRHRVSNGGHGVIVWFTLPFFAAWWLFVSYDPRFLLLFTPILCVGGALAAEAVLARLRLSGSTRVLLAVGMTALALYCAFIAVEFKDEIVRHPLMSHEEKIVLVRGG
ncbi:MAG: glycosyltransferase family 39 protein [Anaerolineae bacterium]|nr:glycosyltransferase family 39 protein [Anaerolineae bacterium]NUQ03402.1 glycosyltransferase family 39 protein [Anaerolineae bacterium]